MYTQKLKFTIIGDSFSGKDFLCFSFLNLNLPDFYLSVSDCHKAIIQVDGEDFELEIFSHCGLDDYSILRCLDYPNTDCFIICYPVTNQTAYEDVEHFWMREIREVCPETPVILVGTKIDERNRFQSDLKSFKPIDKSKGKKLAKRIKAKDFIECSAFEKVNIEKVFEAAVKASTGKDFKDRKNKSCLVS